MLLLINSRVIGTVSFPRFQSRIASVAAYNIPVIEINTDLHVSLSLSNPHMAQFLCETLVEKNP